MDILWLASKGEKVQGFKLATFLSSFQPGEDRCKEGFFITPFFHANNRIQNVLLTFFSIPLAFTVLVSR